MELTKLISSISPLDALAMSKAQERQAQLAKPPGSLARLEELSIQLAGITGNSFFWVIGITSFFTSSWRKESF